MNPHMSCTYDNLFFSAFTPGIDSNCVWNTQSKLLSKRQNFARPLREVFWDVVPKGKGKR